MRSTGCFCLLAITAILSLNARLSAETTLHDPFDDNIIDSSIWDLWGDDYPARFAVEEDGRLEVHTNGADDDSTGVKTRIRIPVTEPFRIQVTFNSLD